MSPTLHHLDCLVGGIAVFLIILSAVGVIRRRLDSFLLLVIYFAVLLLARSAYVAVEANYPGSMDGRLFLNCMAGCYLIMTLVFVLVSSVAPRGFQTVIPCIFGLSFLAIIGQFCCRGNVLNQFVGIGLGTCGLLLICFLLPHSVGMLARIPYAAYSISLAGLALAALTVKSRDPHLFSNLAFPLMAVASVVTICFFSAWLARLEPYLARPRAGYLLGFALLFGGLVLYSSIDMGIFFILSLCLFSMLLLASRNILLNLTVFVAIVSSVGAIYSRHGTLFERVQMMVDPWSNAYSSQLAHSFWKLAESSLWGKGPGLGNPWLVPEVDTDFLFSGWICNELGLVAAAIVIAVFFLIFAATRIVSDAPFDSALQEERSFVKYLAFGSGIFVLWQFVVSVSGDLGLLPKAGIPFPIMGAGKTNCLLDLILLGIVFAVGLNSKQAAFQEECAARRNHSFFLGACVVSLLMVGTLFHRSIAKGDENLTRVFRLTDRSGSKVVCVEYNPSFRILREIWVHRAPILDCKGRVISFSRKTEKGGMKRICNYPELIPVTGKYDHSYCIGPSGIEFEYDTRLAGGIKPIALNADQTRVVSIGKREYYLLRHPEAISKLVKPAPLMVTLDAGLCRRILAAARRELTGFPGKPDRQMCIVLSTTEGKLRALVSTPFLENSSSKKPVLFSAALDGRYEIASIIKLFIADICIQKGINPSSFCTGSAIVAGKPVLCYMAHGWIDLREAVIQSCDVWAAETLNNELGPEEFFKISSRLRIRTNIATIRQMRSYFPYKALGAGIEFCPAELVQYAALIAQGKQYQPSILEEKKSILISSIPTRKRETLGGIMLDVVSRGTARHAGLPPGTGLKTGTRDRYDSTGNALPDNSLCLGFTPAKQHTFFVFVEGGGFGGWTASRIAAAVIRELESPQTRIQARKTD